LSVFVAAGACHALLGFEAICQAKKLSPASLKKDEQRIHKAARGLERKVLHLALEADRNARKQGRGKKNILTIIDYSLPSTKKRLWVIDLAQGKVLFHELVAHGKGSGNNRARNFSNQPDSLASSLGLYETIGTYNGKHGYSLKLKGLEKGFNDKAEDRAIVFHGAWYASRAFADKYGRLGRSWGCPALDKRVVRKVIDTIKNGSLVFIYYPDRNWLSGSRFLTGD